jgi:hypothetical protein
VTDTPQTADHGGVAHAALAADDGGDGNYVIWVRGMAHAKKKAQRDDGN